MKIVNLLLTDRAGTRHLNLTNIQWAWFDTVTVNSLSSPVLSGTVETTDAQGVISVDVSSSTLNGGDFGLLILLDSTDIYTGVYKLKVIET